MRNIMDEYIDFTSKKIKKYMKLIFRKEYDEQIVQEYLKTYINSRYYNINDDENSSRPFYLKITDSLNNKEKVLKKRFQEEKHIFISNAKKAFVFMLFFDNVRKVENFKRIDSIKEVVEQLTIVSREEFKIKQPDDFEGTLYKEITNDMIEKDVFLDNFETEKFILDLKKSNKNDNLYYTTLEFDFKLPIQYSEAAIEKVYNTGIIAENKLEIEYTLLSVVALRDILNGNFKDRYIAEFTNSLFSKKQKFESLLGIVGNEGLQDKIYINIFYKDLYKNREMILEYINRGYNFVISLDDFLESVEEVKKLKMFKYVILPQDINLYKEVKKNKATFSNLIEI